MKNVKNHLIKLFIYETEIHLHAGIAICKQGVRNKTEKSLTCHRAGCLLLS